MFGPPSSPPPALSRNQQDELRSVLLPAFGQDHGSSGKNSSIDSVKSSQFPQPKFTIYRDEEDATSNGKVNNFLPTPMPTSEANMQESSPPPSSPQREPAHMAKTTIGTVTPEARLALQQLVIIRVPTSGSSVTIGRSSKSSNFAVKPSNRLASRVHARLSFNSDTNLLMIECLGWNGLSVTVPQEMSNGGGKKDYQVMRGQTLNIERVDGITMDVHGDRALVEFLNDTNASELTEDESWSQSDPVDFAASTGISSSPARKRVRVDTDDDKENKRVALSPPHEETRDAAHDDSSENTKLETREAETKEGESTQPEKTEPADINDEQARQLEGPDNKESSEFEWAHEKNESESRAETASPFSSRASSVEPSSESGLRKQRRHVETIPEESKQELMNIAANHIAFSRQSAVRFASVRKANSKLQALSKPQVRELIRSIPCIGVIEGGVEDTTGRRAEDEYYYDLDKDNDEERRRAVQGTKGHRSLRNCRKTPKQYFYRPLNLD